MLEFETILVHFLLTLESIFQGGDYLLDLAFGIAWFEEVSEVISEVLFEGLGFYDITLVMGVTEDIEVSSKELDLSDFIEDKIDVILYEVFSRQSNLGFEII